MADANPARQSERRERQLALQNTPALEPDEELARHHPRNADHHTFIPGIQHYLQRQQNTFKDSDIGVQTCVEYFEICC